MTEDSPLTPQQQKFLAAFLDPQSPTWSNYYQSAKEAGYAEEYCQNISGQMPRWLSENISDASLVAKALTNLTEFLDSEESQYKYKSTELVLKGLKKDKFSERKELTGRDGEDLRVLTGFNFVKNNEQESE